MIFQLFVILNKVSKSAEIAFLEFQLLILQEMEHGNIFFSVEIFSKIFAILKLAQRFKKSSLKMRQSSSLNPSLNMKQGLLNNSLYCSWSSSLQSTTNPLLKMSAKHYTDLNKAIWQQLKKKLLISHLRSSSLEGRQLAEY